MPTTIAQELKASTITFYERLNAEVINGILKVCRKGKYGLANPVGELICPCVYDEIEVIGSSFKVKLGKLWGIMDNTGKLLCPCDYRNPLQIDDGGLYFEKDEDVYYIRFKK